MLELISFKPSLFFYLFVVVKVQTVSSGSFANKFVLKIIHFISTNISFIYFHVSLLYVFIFLQYIHNEV
jgi:hypothetical protein